MPNALWSSLLPKPVTAAKPRLLLDPKLPGLWMGVTILIPVPRSGIKEPYGCLGKKGNTMRPHSCNLF